MASAETVKIMGAVGRKKHETTSGDCRDSITMLCTGSAAGRCGPTIFLVKGQRVRQGFNTKFIMKYGAAIGSRIIANKNAYMDTETWLNITPTIIEGY